MNEIKLHTIPDAIEAVKNGEMILVDDGDREMREVSSPPRTYAPAFQL